MEKRRVVITGIGILSPLGNTTQATWESACKGESGIGKITKFESEAFASQIAGEVKNFDASEFMDKKEIKKSDLFSHYAIAASQEAWDDAKLNDHKIDPRKTGCVLGVGLGGLGFLERYHESYLKSGPKRISPFLIPAMISNLAAGHLGIKYNLKGVNFVVSSACTSANHAIGEAYNMIRNGSHDMIVSGGAESTVTAMGIGGFCALKALSTRNDDPTKASRPFDKGRDGFILSEGSAILILESLESAEKRGAHIYAELSGYGVSCDANHITAPCADGSGAMNAMQGALDDAGMTIEDIQYVNAHGTSTPVGDVAETMAVKNLFGAYANDGLLVSSTKSMTGHLLGAAGAIEAAFCALSIKNNIVLPTINLEDPEEGCDLDYVANEKREVDLKVAMTNSFGFGGTNGTLILSEYSA
ncbi:UNVERIFIED_CONTAM: hypothetical protein GTU68_063523 [Idotea baltica]|nr:hypothetical protein [Idotea baltica]